jgi:hypothetical protein
MIDLDATLKRPRVTVAAQAKPQPRRWRGVAADGLALLLPFGLLAGIITRLVTTGVIIYNFPPPSAPYSLNDYVRYINMALPHGEPRYVLQDPFLYRLLVPKTVYLLNLIFNIPVIHGFFLVTCVSLTASVVMLYFLARGVGMNRAVACCAALAFVLLQWAVAYNIYDFYLVDPATQAFIIAILLAAQRQRVLLAAALSAIGIICKETIFMPVAVVSVQLAVPYLRPVPQSFKDLLQSKYLALIKRIPRAIWLRLGLLIGAPLIAWLAIHLIVHPIYPLSLIHVWKHYIPEHFQPNKKIGGFITFYTSTWGAYGVLFPLAVGAMVLKLWPRSGWSFWAMLAAFLIILYSYMVSGESQRLSIIGWPFVIVLSAIMIEEISRQFHVSSLLLWAIVLASEAIFQPTTTKLPSPAQYLGSLAPAAEIVGPVLTWALSLLVIGAIVLLYRRPVQSQEAGLALTVASARRREGSDRV